MERRRDSLLTEQRAKSSNVRAGDEKTLEAMMQP